MGASSSKPTHKYGWKKDKPDPRDQHHVFTVSRQLNIIHTVDLRPHCPPIYDQGNLGSCTANAIGAAYEFDQIIQGEKDFFTPSRLFTYYNERKIENTLTEDSGAELRDGIKTINAVGVCPERDWPYDITKFADEPPSTCYDMAKCHQSVLYRRVAQDLAQLKQCLIEGYPFVFGFAVYQSFESPDTALTGIMKMPQPNETLLGGHAVMAVGFDDSKKMFTIRNSWGESWGDKGYFYMPYDFITNAEWASDFWTVTRVKDLEPVGPPTPVNPDNKDNTDNKDNNEDNKEDSKEDKGKSE